MVRKRSPKPKPLERYAPPRLKEFGQIVGDTKEILEDLARVAQADTDMDETEVNEADYVELYEFVRVAGLLLFADAVDLEPDADADLH